MKLARFAAGLWLGLAAALCVQAENGTDVGDVRNRLDALNAHVEEMRVLNQRVDEAAPGDREALVFRRDERSFELLEDLRELIPVAVGLPEGEPLRDEALGTLQNYLSRAGHTSVQRLAGLQDRIAAERDGLEALGGEQRLTREAHINTLERIRFRYYEALVEIIEERAGLQLSDQSFTPQLRDQLTLHAETLVGHVEFAGGLISDLQVRAKRDPDNADLAAALGAATQVQTVNLERLDAMVGLLDRLDVNTLDYREVVLRQQSGLSLAALEGGALPGLLEDSWQKWWTVAVEQLPEFLFTTLVFLLILLAFRYLSRLVRRLVQAACERPGVKMTVLLKNVLISISGGTVMGIGIMVALSQVGISLGPMLAGLGVAGFIIGFALQDVLGNFAAGAMILIYRPYDVDDHIEVAGANGFVKKMSLVSTTIATIDNQTLVVPNSKIWGDVIKNITAQKVRRVDMTFGIGYGDDIPHAERILRAIVDESEYVLSQPEPQVHLHELGDSSVNFVVRPWVRTEDYWNAYWGITREVKMRFDREGITIPFPQRDVHIYREQG